MTKIIKIKIYASIFQRKVFAGYLYEIDQQIRRLES